MSKIDLFKILPDNILNKIISKISYDDLLVANQLNLRTLRYSAQNRDRYLRDDSISLLFVKRFIHRLNRMLRLSCPDLYITFTPKYDYYFLALFSINPYEYFDNLLSSIDISLHSNTTLDMDSETIANYRGLKYNKLLRAVAIIIAPHIIFNKYSTPRYIRSYAVNPISAITLYKYFQVNLNLVNQDFYNYMLTHVNSDQLNSGYISGDISGDISGYISGDISQTFDKNFIYTLILDYLPTPNKQCEYPSYDGESEDDQELKNINIYVPLNNYNSVQALNIINSLIPNISCQLEN